MSEHRKAWVDLLGVLLFLLPLCGFFVFTSASYVGAAWNIGEVSVNAGGLPYPAVPLLKSIILIMPLAVALQGISILLTSVQVIRNG